MDKVEKLAELLKKTNKMRSKYLAKRLLENDEKRNRVKNNLLEKECYRLLLSLVTDDVKDELLRLDTIIKIIIERIKNDLWKWDGSSFIYTYNSSKKITRIRSGFQGGISLEEQGFIEDNEEGLVVLNNLLNEKEDLLSNTIPLKDEKDRELVMALIDYMDNSKKEVKAKIK